MIVCLQNYWIYFQSLEFLQIIIIVAIIAINMIPPNTDTAIIVNLVWSLSFSALQIYKNYGVHFFTPSPISLQHSLIHVKSL